MFDAQIQYGMLYTKLFKWEQLHNHTLFCLTDFFNSPAVDSSMSQQPLGFTAASPEFNCYFILQNFHAGI